MALIDGIKLSDATSRLMEEAFFAEALREIESGMRRDGIWAMAMAESDMDQGRAAAKYIRLRVQSLKDEAALRLQAAAAQELLNAKRIADAADADAPKHPGCGGTICRTERGTRVSWVCKKCNKRGEFELGVAYGAKPRS